MMTFRKSTKTLAFN